MHCASTYSTLHPRLIRTVCDFNKSHKLGTQRLGKKYDEIVPLCPRREYTPTHEESDDDDKEYWSIIRLPSGQILYMYDYHGYNERGFLYALNNDKTNIIRIFLDRQPDDACMSIINNTKHIKFYVYTRSHMFIDGLQQLQRSGIFIKYRNNALLQKGYNHTDLYIVDVDLSMGRYGTADLFLDSVDVGKLRYLEYFEADNDSIRAKLCLQLLEKRIKHGMRPITYLKIRRDTWNNYHDKTIEVAYNVVGNDGIIVYPETTAPISEAAFELSSANIARLRQLLETARSSQ